MLNYWIFSNRHSVSYNTHNKISLYLCNRYTTDNLQSAILDAQLFLWLQHMHLYTAQSVLVIKTVVVRVHNDRVAQKTLDTWWHVYTDLQVKWLLFLYQLVTELECFVEFNKNHKLGIWQNSIWWEFCFPKWTHLHTTHDKSVLSYILF